MHFLPANAGKYIIQGDQILKTQNNSCLLGKSSGGALARYATGIVCTSSGTHIGEGTIGKMLTEGASNT